MGGGILIQPLLKRTDFWIAALGALALVGVLILGARLDSGKTSDSGSDPALVDYSSYNTGERGLKGIYALLEARGAAVIRWRRPLTSLGPDVQRLVVWQPQTIGLKEWESLERWVKAGGTLVLSMPPKVNVQRILPAGQLASERPYFSTLPELLPGEVSPMLNGVRQLSGREGYVWNRLPDQSGIRTLVADSAGHPVAAGWPLGTGHVYMVAEPSLLTNHQLPSDDNLTLAVNLLDPGQRATLAFDEYHHGARVGEDWWQTLRPQLRWTMLQAVLAALVVMLLAGARLGVPVAVPEGISREAAEFAHGLGNLLRESRANRWVLERLYRSFRQDLARYLGAAPARGHEELARLWHLHTGEPSEPLIDLLDRSAAPEEPSDRDLLATLGRMAVYRRRMGPGPGPRPGAK